MSRNILSSIAIIVLAILIPVTVVFAEEAKPTANSGVDKSRAINDLLSENRQAKRKGNVSVNTAAAERVCFSTSSSLKECQDEVAKAKEELKTELAKLEESDKEEVRTVVDEKKMSNREVQRLATDPANRPRPIGQPAPAGPGPRF